MRKVGLIAGEGILPLEFIRAARERGERVIVFGLEGMADPSVEKAADRVYWVNIWQYRKFVFLLLKERIRRLAFLGKVKKNVIYDDKSNNTAGKTELNRLRDRKDSSIFNEITKRLKKIGIEVIEGTQYLSHLLPEKGVLSRTVPDARVGEDIKFGYEMAKKLAGMDIGQTVVIKDKSVVAIEAMEGTDATIERAGRLAGEGCVMIKVSRPDQDLRWDVPTVGPKTMAKLVEQGFSALAIESGRMFLVEKEKMVGMADSAKIAVSVI